LGLRIVVIAWTLIVIARVMTQTIGDLRSYPGIDLRAKVVGARLLIQEMNPYYDFRHESHPDRLRMLNEDTYSPPLLLLYAPLCDLSWSTQRIVYFCADWIAILLCYLILSRVFPKNASATALWVGFVLLFVAAPGFRMHLERGQYYVELALLTAAASACLLRKSESWFHALPLAILVLLRPTYAVCIVGLLILRRIRHASYASCLCLFLFAAMLPLTGLTDWRYYFTEISTNESELLDAAYRPALQPVSVTTGQVIEGTDFSKSLNYPGYLADRTLLGLARSSVSPSLARLIHQIAPSEIEFRWLDSSGLFLSCLFDLAGFYCFSQNRREGLIPIAFLFLAPLNLELFAPQRFAYCDVTILAPLLLILAATLERRNRGAWFLYGTILATAFVFPWISVHFDKHVPLFSFFSYVGTLAILNLACITECWNLRHRSSRPALSDENVSDTCVATYYHP
jgi:hypothetical protein